MLCQWHYEIIPFIRHRKTGQIQRKWQEKFMDLQSYAEHTEKVQVTQRLYKILLTVRENLAHHFLDSVKFPYYKHVAKPSTTAEQILWKWGSCFCLQLSSIKYIVNTFCHESYGEAYQIIREKKYLSFPEVLEDNLTDYTAYDNNFLCDRLLISFYQKLNNVGWDFN